MTCPVCGPTVERLTTRLLTRLREQGGGPVLWSDLRPGGSNPMWRPVLDLLVAEGRVRISVRKSRTNPGLVVSLPDHLAAPVGIARPAAVCARARDEILALLVDQPPLVWVRWVSIYRRLPEKIRPVATDVLADLVRGGVVRERWRLPDDPRPGTPRVREVRLANHYREDD